MRGSSHQSAPVEKVRSWLSGPHRKCAVWLVSDYYERRFHGSYGKTSSHLCDGSRPEPHWWAPASCWPPRDRNWDLWKTVTSVVRSVAAAARSGRPYIRLSGTPRLAQSWLRYASK
jgi:hypothetical protein